MTSIRRRSSHIPRDSTAIRQTPRRICALCNAFFKQLYAYEMLDSESFKHLKWPWMEWCFRHSFFMSSIVTISLLYRFQDITSCRRVSLWNLGLPATCQLPVCNWNLHKNSVVCCLFSHCNNLLAPTPLVEVFYANVIVYPKTFDPLSTYCIFFWYFCVPCAFVIKATHLLK